VGAAGLSAATLRALLRQRAGLGPVPLSVTLAPTNRCQGRCVYCGIWDVGETSERPVEWWKDLLDMLWRRGCRRVGFTGGEPLLYEDLGDLLSHARRRGMLVSLGTNGLLVPQRRDLLSRLDYLVVSTAGPEGAADRERFEGASAVALEAVRLACAAGVPPWVSVVVTREVARDIAGLLAWARAHRVRLNLQLPFHPESYARRDNRERFPTPHQVRALLAQVLPESRPGGVVLNSPAYWSHVSRWAWLGADRHQQARPGDPPFPPCLAGRLYAHVEPDGRLYPCTHLVGAFEPRSGDDLGQALRWASEHRCLTCLSSYAQEQNLLFGLHPRAVATWLRSIGTMLRGRSESG
jgi:MoaA/NifB/PqqE/SkfB family radical SAM enzyme